MSQEDQNDLVKNYKEESSRDATLDKQYKKKTKHFSAWDKLRENVSEYSSDTLYHTTSDSSRPNMSKMSSPMHKKQMYNPFLRNQHATTAENPFHDKINLTNTTLVAAQAAGMSSFVRNFKSKVGAGRHNGAIYATSTAVQQDIYRLERDLEKLLSHMNNRSQNASFTESESSNHNTVYSSDSLALNNFSVKSASKKTIFHRHSQAVLDPSTQHNEKHLDVTRISANITSIMDIVNKHKSATRLPFTSEILAVLSIPFDRKPQKTEDCTQALDAFDHIRSRFTLLESSEHFEQVLFCCSILGSSGIDLKEKMLDILNKLVEPCFTYPNYLPSTPTAFHALAYALATSFAKQTLNIEVQEKKTTYDLVRSGMLSLLDDLANGKLISVQGDQWTTYYHTTQAASASLAKICMVESLCKCLMVSICRQTSFYERNAELSLNNLIQKDQDIPTLLELLQRYWTEPDTEILPAYFKSLGLLTELASEVSLTLSIENLKSSAIPLLFTFILEKSAPSNVHNYLNQAISGKIQKSVISNIITMLLCFLSVDLLTGPSRSAPSSNTPRTPPNLTPQSSLNDMFMNSPVMDDSGSEAPHIIVSPEEAFLSQLLETAKAYLIEMWNYGYKSHICKCVEIMLQDTSENQLAHAYQNLLFHIDTAIGEEIAKVTMPILFKRILDTSPAPTPDFCGMLCQLSQRFRPLFYKPVVSCVASDDNDKVAGLLKLMTSIRQYLSGVQFWMQDAEMINVLLLSDVGPKKLQRETSSLQQNHTSSTNLLTWGSTTLGQCIIATELVWVLKELREKQKDPDRNMEEDEVAKKFLIDLERRLALFLTAKEKKVLVPLPLRIILCNLFADTRFFCYTTHRPGWLTCAINWATQPRTNDIGSQAISETFLDENLSETGFCSNDMSLPVLNVNHVEEALIMFQRMQNTYLDVVEYFRDESGTSHGNSHGMKQAASSVLFSNTQIIESLKYGRQHLAETMYPINQSSSAALNLNPPEFDHLENNEGESNSIMLDLAKHRFNGIEEINQDPFGSVFSLLAAVYSTLSSHELGRLLKSLWKTYMDDKKAASFTPAAFLLMECGEKIPKPTTEMFSQALQSKDPSSRLIAIQKILSLTGFRLNILNQSYIQISSRNKPFRGDGGAFATPFLPTDLGSNEFSLDEPRWMSKLKNTSNLPIELKRQIQELGWNEDDNAEEQEAFKKALTPLGLLPSLFLKDDNEDTNDADNPNIVVIRERGKVVDISKIITRRKRTATVHSFTAMFLTTVDLLMDDFAGVNNILRELIEQFLKDDPALFLRAFLNNLGKHKADSLKDTLTRIRYIISMQRKLPPGLTHILFNYLAGMLKWIVRENQPDGLKFMTLVHPILAELTLSTNDLSVRDLRKNKIEHLLVSTGKFWFTHEQPADMFPRYLSSEQHSFAVLNIPQQIFFVACLRISHIQFLINYLARFPREVYAVKKTLQDYEPMPVPGSKWETRQLMEKAYYPDLSRRKNRQPKHKQESLDTEDSQQHFDKEMLSLMRARIWLRFIDVLLNGLNKNYNDHDELERILQGVNTIMTEHGHDFGIIGQILILYTRVVTKFKRLFKSNRGYIIFLPALFKVFCESEANSQITSAITFAWCRFYAVHEEAFVFQMLGALVPNILVVYGKSDEVGHWMIENLFKLMQAMDNPPHLGSAPDTLGLQLQVELDDHERSIQDRIDTASSQVSSALSVSIFKPLARGVTAPISQMEISTYNNRPFKLEDFIKLFLTVIAYDPGSLRAEQFVKVFTFLIPFFLEQSHLKSMMHEGVSALVNVFVKFSKSVKSVVTTNSHTTSGEYQGISSSDSRLPGSNNAANAGSKAESAQNAYGKQWQQNDRFTIKQEFITLVHKYMKHGGTLSEVSHEKMAQIIRIVLRDYRNIKGLTVKTDWIKDYLVVSMYSMVDTRNYAKSLKKVLSEIYAQYRVQWKTVDASDLYEGLAIMLEQGQGKVIMMNDLAGLVKEKFVSFGLTMATLTDWQNNTKGQVRFCNSLVRLIIAILENSSQDVFAEIERQVPSVELIGRVIIPLCLQYNLQWEYSTVGISSASELNSANNWTRLLNFIAGVCSHTSLLKSKPSGFSLSQFTTAMGQTNIEDEVDMSDFPEAKDGKQTPQSVAVLFSLSLIAIKIILVRSHNTFNDLKGSWSQIAFFIRNTLVFGQTLKLLKAKVGRSDSYNLASPSDVLSPGMPSPSFFSPLGLSSPGASPYLSSNNPSLSPDLRANFSSNAPLGTGTIYDFTTWRFLEFVVCFRTPLFVLLKDFIHEKLGQMGPNVGSYRNSLYSPRASFNFSQSENTRWKSWGAEHSSANTSGDGHSNANASAHSIVIPKLNVEDTGGIDSETLPTFGLGLHKSNSSTSPGHTAHSPTGYSETDSSSPRSPTANPFYKQQQHMSPGADVSKENILHLLQAETITSVVNVQVAVGFKPALPWIAMDSRDRTKPWNKKEAVARMANEWQLILQLLTETDPLVNKANNNESSANISASPLV